MIRNEFAKMRRLKVGALALLMLGVVFAMAVGMAMGSGIGFHLGDADGYAWKLLLMSQAGAVNFLGPLLIAVLASRQVEIEHRGGGWLLSATAGITPGRLCRVKAVALGAVLVAVIWLSTVSLMGAGTLLRITAPMPVWNWIGYTSLAMVACLSSLGVQLLLSARVENQLASLGLGVLGAFIAVFSTAFPRWISYLTPWGCFSLATPVDFVGNNPEYLSMPYLGVSIVGLLAASGFACVTWRFDRKES